MVYDAASLPDVSTNIAPPSSVVYMSRTWTMEISSECRKHCLGPGRWRHYVFSECRKQVRQ